ncbi:hypothetical protein PBI_CARCHARODON_69 [Mycobacterium phage Carcharodon]|uniref:Uncharacterized protein n=13 Tax=Caudoviricetes TaxID=2731619 RepID=A0A142K7Z1_9CAUD|nr:hypothetical protein AVV74_gp69 [Mycobacterium phage Carcharodon]YP_009616924.1 hypothetical protein FDI84_gp71 [Mycobacterium phage Pipsqueaks]YP_010052001.1 hypothetical protein KD929_gp65 [Mycobacterium phage Aggie]AMS02016.1 hypothetical protein SEA_XERXES_70 [Mycobacterium phage Xerxes]AXQ52639.1 hypothetical protein SEA_GEX_70 [Mycobacterium phage Gex]AIT14577.1 hypothetical protein PBI_CARCHARODON_69 [Mycobacterium phage Carcharodon]AMS02224.1 hypothetical protein SEA_PIPSQUEAKS_71 
MQLRQLHTTRPHHPQRRHTMSHTATQQVAQALTTGLPHPGDDNTPPRVIPMPGFRTTGMSDEQARELVGSSAQLVAEAIVHGVIETDHEILTKTEANELRQAAADAPDGTRVITVYDRADHQRTTPLLTLTIGKSDEVIVDAALLRKALAQ